MDTAPASDPVVSVDGVSKRFGALQALDKVSLRVPPGRFVTLLGPSGCGKTTLLRIVGGLEYADSGATLVCGRPVASFSPLERPTRMVFQSYALFPHMTVAQNVSYGLRLRRLPKRDIAERVSRQLAAVGLETKARAYPHQLSGGQQQRVALARALVTEPKVLLLDEPLAALDLKLRQRLQDELKSIQRSSNITFLYVTHDQGEAMALSDVVVVMNAGRIEQIGAPIDVYRRPSTRFTAEFIGEAALVPGRVVAADARGARLETALGPLDASESGGFAEGDQVLAVVRPEALSLSEADSVHATVGSVTFLGDRYILALEAAAGLRLKMQAPAEIEPPSPGTRIAVAVSPTAVHLVRPSDAPLGETI